MKNILSTVESHGKQLLADEKLRNVLLESQLAAALLEEENNINGDNKNKSIEINDDESNEVSGYNYIVHRSRLLLLRSSISAISTIMTDLSSFSHPYILRTLSATLAVRCINMNTRKKNDNDDKEKSIEISNDNNKKSKLQKKKKSSASGFEIKVKLSKEDVAKQAAEIHLGEVRSLCDDIG